MIDGDAPAASPQTRLTKACGVRYPIAAAGMACVGSTPNAFTGAWAGREAEIRVAPADRPIVGQTNLLGEVFELPKFTNFVPLPTTEGALDEKPMLAGRGIGMIDTIEPTAAILQRMAEDAAQILCNLAQSCARV